MKHKLRVFGFWLWLAAGGGVAWFVVNQSLAVASLVVILYGLAMSFFGFALSIAYSEEKERLSNEARLKLQQDYQKATFQQAVNIRDAMLFLTNASLSRASGKMIAELLPQFSNEEQLDAAITRATGIVEDEMKGLRELIEAN